MMTIVKYLTLPFVPILWSVCLRQQSNVKMLCSKQHCALKFHVINGQNMYDQIMSDKMSKRAQSYYEWWKMSKHAWSDCFRGGEW